MDPFGQYHLPTLYSQCMIIPLEMFWLELHLYNSGGKFKCFINFDWISHIDPFSSLMYSYGIGNSSDVRSQITRWWRLRLLTVNDINNGMTCYDMIWYPKDNYACDIYVGRTSSHMTFIRATWCTLTKYDPFVEQPLTLGALRSIACYHHTMIKYETCCVTMCMNNIERKCMIAYTYSSRMAHCMRWRTFEH